VAKLNRGNLHLIYLVIYLVRPSGETTPQRSLGLSGPSPWRSPYCYP